MKIKTASKFKIFKTNKKELTGIQHRFKKSIRPFRLIKLVAKKKAKKHFRKFEGNFWKRYIFGKMAEHRVRRRRKSIFGKKLMKKISLRTYYGIRRDIYMSLKILSSLKKVNINVKRGSKRNQSISAFEFSIPVFFLVRINFVRSIGFAKQIIRTGNVYVNNKIVLSTDYKLKPLDIITIKASRQRRNHILHNLKYRGLYKKSIPAFFTIIRALDNFLLKKLQIFPFTNFSIFFKKKTKFYKNKRRSKKLKKKK